MNRSLFVALILLSISSCKLDYVNPNAAKEEDVFTTKEGLFSLCIGLRQNYSTNALRHVILVPAVTTREMAVMNTFRYLIDLETGGVGLNADNNYTYRVWSNLLRAKGIAENLILHAAQLPMDEGTRTGMIAYGKLFRAMCIGYLAQTYTHLPHVNQLDGQAPFISSEEGLQEAIRILEEGIQAVNQIPVSDEFKQKVLKDQLSLSNCLYAFLARYHLLAGNYQEAIAAAQAVNLSSKSVFTFDSQNQNPIYNAVYIGVAEFAARDNFGAPFSYNGDGRKEFYFQISANTSRVNALPIDVLRGFFDENKPLPVYLPGEILLIQAEAYVRLAHLPEAVILINLVRTKKDDPFGVNAKLPAYAGELSSEALLQEIYYNRCAELYLTGMRLADSRRFMRPEPGPNPELSTERNRNFYPFPRSERLNNLNTPTDPPI